MKARKKTRITAALLLNLGIDGYEWEFPHFHHFNPGKNKELFTNLNTG